MSVPPRRVATGVRRSRIRPRSGRETLIGPTSTTESITSALSSRGTHSTAQTITAVVTSINAVGALVFTGLSLDAVRQQNQVSAEGQYTDRYIRAIEQLDKAGPGHLQGRLGGIYALERLARDSPRDQPTIVEVLSGFIRTTSRRPLPSTDLQEAVRCPEQQVPADIQAALDVLGRRDTTKDNGTHVNLSRTCLGNVNLVGANLEDANLSDANLEAADFDKADLGGANLTGANLNSALFSGANIGHANLAFADLAGALLKRWTCATQTCPTRALALPTYATRTFPTRA